MRQVARDQQLRELALGVGQPTAVLLELPCAGAGRTQLLPLDDDPSDLLGQRLDRRSTVSRRSEFDAVAEVLCTIAPRYAPSRRPMNFDLQPEHELLRDTVRQFALEKIAPVAEELDREKRFPYELVAELAELGLMGMTIPEEYGGARQPTRSRTRSRSRS